MIEQYVGYPRKGISDAADRIQALGYAEITLNWLVLPLMLPMLVPKEGLASLGVPGMIAFAVYNLAASTAIFKCYFLLAKGRNWNRLIAVVPALAYCLGLLFLVTQYGRAGGSIAIFLSVAGIVLPGKAMAHSALAKLGLQNGASSFKQLKLAVEERRRATPPTPAELFSGEAPKPMA